ncbi:MAG: hypothetical protein HN337_00015 [Deltaproteobacteria bacterium]|jgi:phosphopantothenoylcysteine decarboxylase / phosphopantothenate---cysteine ligase|nr:hypothetical protein [Deltaproteobacteria bacterium]
MTSKSKNPKPLRILIAAGPTREYIDPVRYISNDSSGQMGFALARAAIHLNCNATLVAGPVDLETPDDVKRINVLSAKEMHEEMMKQSKRHDVIIMAAAVADFSPRISKDKIKKTPKNAKGLILKLNKTKDILALLCKKRSDHQTIVGFALETKDLEKNARKKLNAKGCDWIIANSSKTIGSKSCKAILIEKSGEKTVLPHLNKEDLAIVILSHIL